jgi:hypothetical protein
MSSGRASECVFPNESPSENWGGRATRADDSLRGRSSMTSRMNGAEDKPIRTANECPNRLRTAEWTGAIVPIS